MVLYYRYLNLNVFIQEINLTQMDTYQTRKRKHTCVKFSLRTWGLMLAMGSLLSLESSIIFPLKCTIHASTTKTKYKCLYRENINSHIETKSNTYILTSSLKCITLKKKMNEWMLIQEWIKTWCITESHISFLLNGIIHMTTKKKKNINAHT